MKKNKLLLNFSTLLLPVSFATLATACGKDSEIKIENSNKLVINQVNPLTKDPFFLDLSTEGQTNIEPGNLLKPIVGGNLFRNQTIKSPEYNDDEKASLKNSGIVKYAFELAKSITITLENGETKVYDNDNAEIINNNGNVYEYATSNDAKSINSAQFKIDMQNAKKIAIGVKEEIKWVNSKGEKTEYSISAKDFWYSYLRSYYTGFFQRAFKEENGNYQQSSLSDKYNRERLKTTSRFNGSLLFTNSQQFAINGLDMTKFIEFDNESFEPTRAVANNELVFEAIENENNTFDESKDFFNFFDLLLVKSQIFSAAPSQYINFLNKSHQASETIEQDGQTIHVNGQSIVNKIGLYYYGTNGWENNLYAGAYIPVKLNDNENEFNLKLNEQLFDSQNLPTIKEIQISSGINDSSLNFNNFKNGENAYLKYSSLSETEKNYINQNSTKFNLVKFKNYLKTKSIGNTAFNITPKVAWLENGELKTIDYEKVAFNENYAKLVYGSTFAEINRGWRGTDFNSKTSIGAGVFENKSIAFRSLINAAINWKYIADLQNNTDLWLTNAAPDALLGGTNQKESKYKTARDAKDIINNLMAIDKNGNLVNFDDANKNSSYQNTYKSVFYDQIKPLISELLDEFYQSNSLTNEQKIKWIIYNNVLVDKNEANHYANIVNILKELDSRIEPEFRELKTQKDINDVIGAYNGGGNNSVAQYITYSYEFDTLSPYLDKITHAIGLSPFALWHKFSTLEPNSPLRQAFPELVRFSETLKQRFESGQFKYNEIYTGGILENRPENLNSVFKKIEWNDLAKFNSYEERELYLRGIYLNNAWQNAGFGGLGYEYAGKGIFKIDNILEQSKYARYYLTQSTNEQLVELLRELNTWRSFNIDLSKTIPTLSETDVLIAHKNLNPIVSFNNVTYVQDFKSNK
ncbi:OppA family ABC transporter substrate-binding lipoprotein [Mycoplasmopsis gallinarum]